MSIRKLISAASAIGLLAAWGCSSDSTFDGECKRDADCPQFERCDTRDYRCVCASDEACLAGEYCNPSGSCQLRSDCFSNADCETNSICDILSGECISSLSCTLDLHCELGQICLGGKCETGCRESYDCDLYRPDGPEVCRDGQCRFGLCESNDQCQFGYVCDPQSSTCVPPSQPHCQSGCSPICEGCTDLTQGPCGDPANICAGEGPSYCWVACSQDAQCPSGYSCVPTTADWATCTEDIDCSTVQNSCGQFSHRCALNQQPCESDLDCHVFPSPVCMSNFCVFAFHCEPAGGCQP